MKNIEEIAKEISLEFHAGQFRRDGVTPYFVHPEAVALGVKKNGGSSEEVATAYTHDTLEDTTATPEILLSRGLPQEVVTAVIVLTKKDGVPYGQYLEEVAKNPIAITVKLEDIKQNLSDAPTEKQIKKYTKALEYFESLGASISKNSVISAPRQIDGFHK